MHLQFYKNIFWSFLIAVFFVTFYEHAVLAQTKDLNYYLKTGLSKSPLLKEQQNLNTLNTIDCQRLQASLNPQVSFISANTISPIISGLGFDPILTNNAAFYDILNVNKTFLSNKNLATQNKIYGFWADSINNEKKISEQDIKRTITTQYITTYGDMQQLDFYTEVYQIFQAQEAIIKSLTTDNIYRQTDYLTFLVSMKQQELMIKQMQLQAQNNFASLNYLCGICDTHLIALPIPDLALQGFVESNSSVFFHKFIIDSFILQNNLQIIQYTYKPKINAFANSGFVSSFQYKAWQNFGYNFGVNLIIPIYDGHQKKLLEQKIGILQNTLSNYSSFFNEEHNSEIARLQQQLSATNALISDIKEQIKYADALIAVNRKLLQTGDAKIADFIIAINSYLSSKNLLTQNTISRLQIINQLNYWNR